MEKSTNPISKQSIRRQRQHELLIALINSQEVLELIEAESPRFDVKTGNENDPARWIEKNRHILEKYQSLVKSAITLDALLESEQSLSE